MIMCGDFNIDLNLKQTRPDISALNNLCRDYNLQQCITIPTRHGYTKNSILDLFLTDSSIVSHAGTVNYNISDHLPIFITIKKSKEHYAKVTFKGRSYAAYTKENFQSDLLQINWGRFYGTVDMDEAWSIFYTHLLNTCNEHAPMKTFSVRKNRPPWFSDEITELSANRDNLYKIGRHTKNL